MSPAVPVELRRFVAERAGHFCEYCRIPESVTSFGCQIDHTVSAKHGGETTADNLCYARVFRNRFKGSDLGSVESAAGVLIRFFNPRIDRWDEHFERVGDRIEPRSAIGAATTRILRFNDTDRVVERRAFRN